MLFFHGDVHPLGPWNPQKITEETTKRSLASRWPTVQPSGNLQSFEKIPQLPTPTKYENDGANQPTRRTRVCGPS